MKQIFSIFAIYSPGGMHSRDEYKSPVKNSCSKNVKTMVVR